MRSELHPPHIYEANACYFLTARTVRRRRLFGNDLRRALLQELVQACAEQYGIKLHAWVILANHYHLLLRVLESAALPGFVRTLHAKSALELNKLDGVRGRKVWYQYWDRFANSKQAFWSYFNYVHINPLKHGYVQLSSGALRVEGGMVRIEAEHSFDVHECLAGYPWSSYHYYLYEYGAEFLTDAWVRYPIPDYLAAIEA